MGCSDDAVTIEVKEGISLRPDQGYLDETVSPLTPFTAAEEAARCLLCHDAPCTKACPAGTRPDAFIRAIRFQNTKGAAEIIRSNNILGGICARVCPFEKTCEGACARTVIDRPIQIGRLHRYETDNEKATGFRVLEAPPATKAKVATIGTGPGALSAAASLAMMGHPVTMFEANERAGGVLSYGIVPARLPQYVVDEEIDHVRDLGVEIVLNTRVGTDITVDEIRNRGYKAIVLGAGLQYSKLMDIPGTDLNGVEAAVEYLANAKSSNGKVDPGKRVVVIGGGDVAMDCATTARLLGAEKVTVLYRRTREEAPANREELQYCESIGINFAFTFSPTEVVGEGGKVVSIKAAGTRDASSIEVEADTVIFAIGQEPADFAAVVEGLGLARGMYVENSGEGRTSVADVFVVGDIDSDSTKTVVNAVADGKTAATSIAAYLAGKGGN